VLFTLRSVTRILVFSTKGEIALKNITDRHVFADFWREGTKTTVPESKPALCPSESPPSLFGGGPPSKKKKKNHQHERRFGKGLLR